MCFSHQLVSLSRQNRSLPSSLFFGMEQKCRFLGSAPWLNWLISCLAEPASRMGAAKSPCISERVLPSAFQVLLLCPGPAACLCALRTLCALPSPCLSCHWLYFPTRRWETLGALPSDRPKSQLPSPGHVRGQDLRPKLALFSKIRRVHVERLKVPANETPLVLLLMKGINPFCPIKIHKMNWRGSRRTCSMSGTHDACRSCMLF